MCPEPEEALERPPAGRRAEKEGTGSEETERAEGNRSKRQELGNRERQEKKRKRNREKSRLSRFLFSPKRLWANARLTARLGCEANGSVSALSRFSTGLSLPPSSCGATLAPLLPVPVCAELACGRRGDRLNVTIRSDQHNPACGRLLPEDKQPWRFPEFRERRHFLPHLRQASSLDEVVELAQRCVTRETLDVPEEVLGLGLKQTPDGTTKGWLKEWVGGWVGGGEAWERTPSHLFSVFCSGLAQKEPR